MCSVLQPRSARIGWHLRSIGRTDVHHSSPLSDIVAKPTSRLPSRTRGQDTHDSEHFQQDLHSRSARSVSLDATSEFGRQYASKADRGIGGADRDSLRTERQYTSDLPSDHESSSVLARRHDVSRRQGTHEDVVLGTVSVGVGVRRGTAESGGEILQRKSRRGQIGELDSAAGVGEHQNLVAQDVPRDTRQQQLPRCHPGVPGGVTPLQRETRANTDRGILSGRRWIHAESTFGPANALRENQVGHRRPAVSVSSHELRRDTERHETETDVAGSRGMAEALGEDA